MSLPLAARLAALLIALAAGPAVAEKADRDKPTEIEADRMTSDEVRRLTVFQGNVLLTKGTLTVHADRIVVRQDVEGYQHSVATGAPVRFKQRQDPKDPKEGKSASWVQGEALRIEIDDRKSTVELFDKAWVKRDGDEIHGDHIFVDQRADFYSATAAKDGATGGRVRATLQPKGPPTKPAAPEPKPAPPATKPAPAAPPAQ